MSGEDRSDLEAGKHFVDEPLIQPDRDDPIDSCVEIAVVAGHLLDAVHLLGDVRKVEVGGECTDQGYDVRGVELAQQGVKLGRGRVTSTTSGRLAEGAHFFHEVEEILSVLANQGVAQLVAETAYVGA